MEAAGEAGLCQEPCLLVCGVPSLSSHSFPTWLRTESKNKLSVGFAWSHYPTTNGYVLISWTSPRVPCFTLPGGCYITMCIWKGQRLSSYLAGFQFIMRGNSNYSDNSPSLYLYGIEALNIGKHFLLFIFLVIG